MLELELTPEFEPRELNVTASIGNVVYRDGGGVSAELKAALLEMAEKVAYIDANGQSYYDDLYRALYPLAILTAVFVQGDNIVYNTDSLDSLKPMLTVTAMYSDGTSAVVTDYILSGSLTAGTSTITVSYGGKTATFDVTVTAVAGVYSVANTLTGCTNSNSATTATEGAAYSGTITAASGYTLTGAAVSITMGGVDITSTAYSNGTISIAAVTGDIAISVTAAAVVLSSISAVYTQSGTVYDTDTLDSLKPDLVVTATYSDSSTATVPSADYTLSGTLAVGTSTITVSYGGKTDTFTVTVSAYVETPIYNWDFTQSLVDTVASKEVTVGGSASRDSNGLHLTAATDYIVLDNLNVTGYTFEIDISEYDRKGINHGRLFCISQAGTVNSGVIYRSTGVWSIYTSEGSAWHDTSISSPAYFDGKTITVKIEKNGSDQKIMSLYEGATLLTSGLMTKTTTSHVYIGSNNGNNAYNLTITGIRVYDHTAQ